MTFQLDTSGAVAMGSEHGPQYAGVNLVWSDLSPFAQGYIEALLRNLLVEREIDRKGQTLSESYASFSDLAPETLARIIADCESLVDLYPGWNTRECGPLFWSTRQAGFREMFPPLTVKLGNDGKVRFA